MNYDMNSLEEEALVRWLKPPEVYFILQNHENHHRITHHKSPHKPSSGSLFLFNKRVLRFFRRDGHNWRKKKDGKTLAEAHERLKVGNAEALNCYYAHGEDNPSFQRRSYWMLDPEYEHIVLVHYRDITEGRHISHLSPGSTSALTESPNSFTNNNNSNNPRAYIPPTGVYESSTRSAQSTSLVIIKENETNHKTSSHLHVNEALRRLEEQLSLNDDSNDVGVADYATVMKNHQGSSCEYVFRDGPFAGMENVSNNFVLQQDTGGHREYQREEFGNKYFVDWVQMPDFSPDNKSQDKYINTLEAADETPLSSSVSGPFVELENGGWLHFDEDSENLSVLLPREDDGFELPTYFPVDNYEQETNAGYSEMMLDHNRNGMPFEAASSLTIAETQKFTIREISPEWCYSSENTKVIIIGSFLCNPSESAWSCMFGNIEVPIQIIQEGVIVCQSPPSLSGKVTVCITSGNRESCSEVREFEFRVKTSYCTPQAISRSPEELVLLVRFVQILLSDPLISEKRNVGLGMDVLLKVKADEDTWDQVIEELSIGNRTSLSTMDWIMQELLKDKLQQWISSKFIQLRDHPGSSLSRKEQGIIHMIAWLGFEWALNPILTLGVGINFRDNNGWTALHWAARFGREKMVAGLIACGASPGAVTDPNSQDPRGKTAASIAAMSGHNGLAGYLSELSLTTHLLSLTLEESELSKVSAEMKAEMTINGISHFTNYNKDEDELSLQDTLAAVRNAAQAAARIQSAFRAHSFRRRTSNDEYGIGSNEQLSALSKLAFRNVRDSNSAALSIQKKYRGWKGRKDFLAFRQKVVKIQAHVRGHQVRKNYKVICWAVGILDKVILRWRRGGVGLRGFRPETDDGLNKSEDEEDLCKVFRRQKVDGTIDEAVSRVLSMVESPDARHQYRRMLERYREAKAQQQFGSSNETLSDEVFSNSMDGFGF